MRLLLTVGCLVAAAALAFAEDPTDREVWIQLDDGSRLVGRIVEETETEIEVATSAGATLRLPRGAVRSVVPRLAADNVADPNDSRLFFAPTGRPLRRGTGQFSDHWLFFPGVSYGLTDNVTLMGGMSLVPGAGLDEQLLYFAPKIGTRVTPNLAVSAGYLLVRVSGGFLEEGGGIGYAVATLGGSERSATLGFGLAHGGNATRSILMVGGQARVGRRIFLLTENWLFLGSDFSAGDQPFSAGLRFCGDRLSVDFGLVLFGELLEAGVFPIPWLSFSYQFGTPQRAAASRARVRASPARLVGPPAPSSR